MPRVAVGGIIVDRQAALGDIGEQLAARERQQRPHQPAASARRDSRETGGRAAAQPAQHDGLDLIVFVMRGHEIPRAAAFLHFTEPRVARAPCFGLRGVRPETQLRQLERQTILLREGFDRQSDHPTV